MGVLQVLGVVMESELTRGQEQDTKRLSYVLVELNGNLVLSMLDAE
jgi:hypothetical protein